LEIYVCNMLTRFMSRGRPHFILTCFLFFSRKRLAHLRRCFIFRFKIGIFGRKWHRK